MAHIQAQIKALTRAMSANSWRSLSVVAFVLVLAGLFYFGSIRGVSQSPGASVILDGKTISVSIADTEAAREKGLGGRTSLGLDEGMLFVFPKEGKYAFWMKDMRFAIDIVWLSKDSIIIYMKENISPDTYPASFAPNSPAAYVLELPAGYAESHGVRIGDKVAI